MADIYSAIILDTEYWDGTESWAGETTEGNRDTKYGARRFTSYAAWEADRDGNSSGGNDEYGIISGPWASADTSSGLTQTWGADNIICECPLTLPDGDNPAAHDGIYGNKANAYKHESTSGDNFYLRDESVSLIGIQIKNINAFEGCIRCRGNGDAFYIKRCVMDATATNADGIQDGGSSNCDIYVENTAIAADKDGIRLLAGTAGHIINCTINGLGGAGNGLNANATFKIRNCAVFNTADDFVTVTDVSYCASDDGDGTNEVDWDNEATDWAANFEGYAVGDFRPKDADLPGAGIGPGSDADIPTVDIIGNSRSGATCTIGAFEFQAVGGLSIPVAMYHYRSQQ